MQEALKDAIRSLFALVGLEVRRKIVPPSPHLWVQRLGIDTILDIGANVGQFAKEARRTFPRARIYSFEPLQDCHARLRRAFADDPLFASYNVALSDTSGSVTFHRSSSSPSSSLMPMADLHKASFETTAGEKVLHVEARRLDDIAGELSIGEHLLVKIDVQGAEDRVIRGGSRTIRRADVIIAETSFFRLYDGQKLFRDIFEMITAEGFRYLGCAGGLRHPRTGLSLSEDSLFINEQLEAVVTADAIKP